jgi:hypothetical protein
MPPKRTRGGKGKKVDLVPPTGTLYTTVVDKVWIFGQFLIGPSEHPRIVWTKADGGRFEVRWKVEEQESSALFDFSEVVRVGVSQEGWWCMYSNVCP